MLFIDLLAFMDPLDKQSAQVQVTMSAETGVGSGGAMGELHPQALLLVLSGANKSWPMGNSEGSGDEEGALSTLGWPWLGGQRLQACLENIQSGGDQRWPRETERRAVRT